MNNNEFKFTAFNFKEIFPNSPMIFDGLANRNGHLDQKMKAPNHQRLINYLYINDIIRTLEKGIRNNNSPNRNHVRKWKYFLDNDIQEYIDNQHEQSQNET